MRRKIGLAVRRAQRARGSRPMAIVRRRSRALFRRAGGGVGGRNLMGTFRQAVSRGLLLKAGGAVAASFGTGWILNRFGAVLPLANNRYGRVIYTLGIPIVAAWAIGRRNRDLAEGIVIGGLVMTVNTLMQGFRTPAAPAPVGAYAVAGELGQGSFSYYPQSLNDASALGGGNVAFPQSAW